uniref:Uncharacterized protein n=1 Tax=Acrobeloides nanus TaxID=290746 RepID=A0A914EAB9_9BILA
MRRLLFIYLCSIIFLCFPFASTYKSQLETLLNEDYVPVKINIPGIVSELSGSRISKPFSKDCTNNTCSTACTTCLSDCLLGFCAFNEVEGNDACYCSPLLCC